MSKAGPMVEIHGAQFRNKGAQLMLIAVREKLLAADPSIRMCMEHVAGDSEYPQRASLSMFQPFPGVNNRRPNKYELLYKLSALIGRYTPEKLCRAYGLVRRQDIDALIDVSGYAFGDGFPSGFTNGAAVRAENFKKRGKPALFLPQMLGPYTKPGQREAFTRLFHACDVLFARDRVSYATAVEIVGEHDKLRRAPDITIFVDPLPNPEPLNEPYGLLVPNVRMLEQGKGKWGDVYMDRMVAAGNRMAGAGVRPRVLVHDAAGGDAELGREIAQKLGTEVVTHAEPRSLKGIVSEARMLVGSRFHSVVASLSTGVPAIALGWAHKYEMILEDFGAPDMIHNAEDGDEGLYKQLDELLDQGGNEARRSVIRAKKEEMRPANTAMWKTVFEHLGLPWNESAGKAGLEAA